MTPDELAEEYWEFELSRSPSMATLYGFHGHDDELEDLSADGERTARQHYAALRSRVDRLAPTTHDERVTTAMLGAEIDASLVALGGADGDRPSHAVMTCEQMEGPHLILLRSATQMTYPEPEHAEAAVERLGAADRLLSQALDRFREGLDLGLTPVARNVRHLLDQVDGYLSSPLSDDPLAGVSGPEDWDGEARWREQLTAMARDVVRPAMQRYRDAVEAELLPHGRDDEHGGLSWLDGGDALYGEFAWIYTSLDVDPDEVHTTGREYIDGPLAAEFSELGARLFGLDEVPDIFDRMRTDADMRYASGDQMLSDATEALEAARAVMHDWFGRLPEADCTVRPVPDYLAASSPPAYYFPPTRDGSRGGTYFLNTANAESMYRPEGLATAFHEAIPGHHLQLAIAGELDGVPHFQQYALQTAYAEGWGLYAERLADEMGLYRSDRDRFGMLALDAFRASRLVVDTGLHARGWSRAQAVDYMRRFTPLPHETIDVEVDRYIALPGQALSYKLGQLEIRRLREAAEARLGDRFDIRGFHDTVLGSGMVTLGVLADLVDDWSDRRAGAART